MSFTPGAPRPPNAGRKRGARNRRTIEAAIAKTDALKFLSDLIDSEDPDIGRDLKVKAAICLAGYQRARPAPVQTEMFLTPVDYTAPTSPEEARQTVLSLGQRLARGEVSLQAHDSLVAGLKAYLGDQAMALEAQVAELESLVYGGVAPGEAETIGNA